MARRILQRPRPDDFDPAEWELLVTSQQRRSGVRIVVTDCVYSCCGKGWQPRTGYEQTYHGVVGHLSDSSFTLMSAGIGTISYTVVVEYHAVALVEALD